MMLSGFFAWLTSERLALALCMQSALLTFLCFARPLILTNGFSLPLPSSEHLALISKQSERRIAVLAGAIFLAAVAVHYLVR